MFKKNTHKLGILQHTTWQQPCEFSPNNKSSAHLSHTLIIVIIQAYISPQSYDILNNITTARLLRLVIAMSQLIKALLGCWLNTTIGCNRILLGKSHAAGICRRFGMSLYLMKLIVKYEIAPRIIFRYITFICVIHLLQNQLKNKLSNSKFLFIGHKFQ